MVIAGKVSIQIIFCKYLRLRPMPGNVGTLLETGDVVLYDAGLYDAHNEMELGIWRCEWGQFFRASVYSMNCMRN